MVWEGDLLRSIDKYKDLRSCLISLKEQGILDSLWNSYPYIHTRTYKQLVKEFISEYVNLVVRKTDSLVYVV